MSLFRPLFLFMSLYSFVPLSRSLSVSLSLCLSASLSLCLSVSVSLCKSKFTSYISTKPSHYDAMILLWILMHNCNILLYNVSRCIESHTESAQLFLFHHSYLSFILSLSCKKLKKSYPSTSFVSYITSF